VSLISIALFARLRFTVTMGEYQQRCHIIVNEHHFFLAVLAESLVMLVNEFVLSTQIVVQNTRAN
jgi:hypothetical protein